ncbi:MAG: ATP-binding protein [Egibacteraceae bacterium]
MPAFAQLRGQAAARLSETQPGNAGPSGRDTLIASGGRFGPAVLELAATPVAVGLARAFVAGVLASESLDEIADTARLLVSELVTNAVCHARSRSRLELTIGEHSVRIDLIDHSGEPPTFQHAPLAAGAHGGQGLRVVDALADRWGHEQLDIGKRVWFELDLSRQQ